MSPCSGCNEAIDFYIETQIGYKSKSKKKFGFDLSFSRVYERESTSIQKEFERGKRSDYASIIMQTVNTCKLINVNHKRAEEHDNFIFTWDNSLTNDYTNYNNEGTNMNNGELTFSKNKFGVPYNWVQEIIKILVLEPNE